MSGDNLTFNHSRAFTVWLLENKCSIVISCYRKHKLFCLGVQGNGEVSTYFLNTLRPMGLVAHNNMLISSSLGNITTYVADSDENHKEWGYFDSIYRPTHVYLSADSDVHDLRIDPATSSIYYVSALFNCICTPSTTKSFNVYWTPPWITKDKHGNPPCEDRCHLNGMALFEGKPRFVTACCISDYHQAWREHQGEGVVYDILEETIVAHGLWAPHSPNWYRNQLWIAEAGTGQFGYVDLDTRKFVPKKFVPGFIRGITFFKNFALVNTSMDRHDVAFKDIPLGDILQKENRSVRAGVHVIDMDTPGLDIKHWFEFLDPKTELYDIACIENTRRIRILETNELKSDKFYL